MGILNIYIYYVICGPTYDIIIVFKSPVEIFYLGGNIYTPVEYFYLSGINFTPVEIFSRAWELTKIMMSQVDNAEDIFYLGGNMYTPLKIFILICFRLYVSG